MFYFYFIFVINSVTPAGEDLGKQSQVSLFPFMEKIVYFGLYDEFL